MISSISRSPEWIYECARRNNISDLGLLEKAILCASKAAYLAAMMISGKTKVERYSLESPVLSEEPEWPDYRFNKFNKFKKTSPEVFYYWAQTAKLLSR